MYVDSVITHLLVVALNDKMATHRREGGAQENWDEGAVKLFHILFSKECEILIM